MPGKNIFQNVTKRGTIAAFHTALEEARTIYRNNCTVIPSEAGKETHVWLGAMPEPRINMEEIHFEGLLDFTYDVENEQYTMHVLVSESSIEDDQHGLVMKKIRNAATAFETFKDKQVATLLEGSGTAFDGVAFFADTRVIGKSANIDNNLADSAPTDAAAPTPNEFLNSLKLCLDALWTFQDDQGNSGYNNPAMGAVRLIIPPKYQRAASEAVNSTIIANTSNPWGQNIAEVDILPQLTAANNVFFTMLTGDALGRPLILQERTSVQFDLLDDRASLVSFGGLVGRVRQRYRIAFGDPERAVKMSLS